MRLFSQLNDLAPNVVSMFIREYEASGCDIPIAQYPDAALRGLILAWLQEYMDIVLSDLVAQDLFGGSDKLLAAFIELEKEYQIK